MSSKLTLRFLTNLKLNTCLLKTPIRFNSSKNYSEPQFYYKAKSFKQMLKIPSGKLVRAFLISSSLTLFCLSGFYGSHWYIENYLHPTDPSLSEEVRMFLRGAYIREEVAPDPTVVELYLSKARDKMIKDKEVELDSLLLVDVSLRLAKSMVLRKKFVEATELFQICEFSLQRKLQVEKLNKEERLEVVDKLVDLTQVFGKVYFELQNFEQAKLQFQLGVQTLENCDNLEQAKEQQIEVGQYDFSKRKVDLQLLLAGTEAKLGNLELSLTTYKQILNLIQNHPPQPQDKNDDQVISLHPWGCVEAIVYTYLAEVTYATLLPTNPNQAIEQSVQLAWLAYTKSKPYIDISLAGDKTAALSLYCLGKLYLLESKLKDEVQACACLAKAIKLADRACEYQLTLEVANLLAKVQPEEVKE